MAIKNTVAIEFSAGFSIPANNVIVVATYFPKFVCQYDENGVYTGVVRVITYDLMPYWSEADITTEGKDFVGGSMVLVPSGWDKIMTDQEYAALLANGALAEVWLKDQLNIWLVGNAATVIDPY
jgi:hypothetical protein